MEPIYDYEKMINEKCHICGKHIYEIKMYHKYWGKGITTSYPVCSEKCKKTANKKYNDLMESLGWDSKKEDFI